MSLPLKEVWTQQPWEAELAWVVGKFSGKAFHNPRKIALGLPWSNNFGKKPVAGSSGIRRPPYIVLHKIALDVRIKGTHKSKSETKQTLNFLGAWEESIRVSPQTCHFSRNSYFVLIINNQRGSMSFHRLEPQTSPLEAKRYHRMGY